MTTRLGNLHHPALPPNRKRRPSIIHSRIRPLHIPPRKRPVLPHLHLEVDPSTHTLCIPHNPQHSTPSPSHIGG